MTVRRSAPTLFPSTAAPTTTQAGWLHAHCDGGARGNPGPAGFGALLTEGDGTVVAELSEFLGIRSNNYAEYSGLLACLEYALRQGRGQLKVVSDSELMVRQIQGRYQVKSPDLKPLYEEAKRRIAQLEGFQIEHALRHKNKDADRLANEAMDRGMKRPAPPATVTVGATPRREEVKPIPISPRGPVAAPAPPPVASGTMLRGFARDGVVHLLGGAKLPDGVFVKVIPE